MFTQTLSAIAVLATLANAHFGIDYPEMRGDSFAEGASQYIFPCANVNQTTATNRTQWPLTGGSLSLDLHHQWTYVFVNLGLGTDYPVFNISLTPQLLNETGNGTLCLPSVALPAGLQIADGQNASVQVVTVGESGSALYNCADITFSSTATTLGADTCSNSSNVAVAAVGASSANASSTDTAAAAASSTSTSGAASTVGSSFGTVVLAALVAGYVL
ncbi:Uncharacterized protein PVAG01_04661 [Phlyctema vagabunda]|uniref:Copper acquisition factor BIM1-like domain-containing protein n=1 Tax=Phlyctema vagabunda TaxID=108571 RepID=A0ABR4PHU7_9HELO